MAGADSPGWFGKLASQGDFASRRLAPDWVTACDGWLSAGLQASRQQLGEQWLERYLAAPVWRFAWAPGVVDAQWWFGVLMPSCDNVGRYYPLLIAQARAQAPSDRITLNHLELWWQHLAGAALQTLAEGASMANLEQALSALPPWPSPAAAGPALLGLAMAGGGRERWSPAPGAGLADLLLPLAAMGLQQRMAGHSLWWPLQPGAETGAFTLAPGLPPAEAFVDLLTGAW